MQISARPPLLRLCKYAIMKPVDGYRFTLTFPVIFHDLDAMGHVNNVVYLTHFETARIAYYMHLMGAHDLPQLRRLSMILAEVTCTYHSPAYFGEVLVVGVRMEEIKNHSFVLSYRVEEQKTGRLVATGRSVQVSYDYVNKQKMPVPPELIKAAEEYEGRPLRVRDAAPATVST